MTGFIYYNFVIGRCQDGSLQQLLTDATAQHQLGLCYARGDGVPHDVREAARYYQLAADQGNAAAQCNLVACYAKGAGVPQDYREAARLYRLAADQGNADGRYRLGLCYAAGQGVPKDESEAARLFRLAADQGNANGRHYLGLCFADGRGVPQDEREAERYYRLTADQCHVHAQLALGAAILGSSAEPAAPERLREGALLLARAAQQTGDASSQQEALGRLSKHADKLEVMHACCIGCGKSRGLKVCGKCRVAKWCGTECAKRMWPVHKACCRRWAQTATH